MNRDTLTVVRLCAVNVEDVGALVQHYIKKFSHFSSWQKPDDKLLAKTGKQLIKATKDTKGKLKGALSDFAQMKVDPKFADWMVDMCPCPNGNASQHCSDLRGWVQRMDMRR